MNSDFLKIVAGRGDLAVSNSQVSNYMIKNLGLKNEIGEIPTVLDSSTLNLCIRKRSLFVKILPDFDGTIIEMRKDKTIQTIFENMNDIHSIACLFLCIYMPQ